MKLLQLTRHRKVLFTSSSPCFLNFYTFLITSITYRHRNVRMKLHMNEHTAAGIHTPHSHCQGSHCSKCSELARGPHLDPVLPETLWLSWPATEQTLPEGGRARLPSWLSQRPPQPRRPPGRTRLSLATATGPEGNMPC